MHFSLIRCSSLTWDLVVCSSYSMVAGGAVSNVSEDATGINPAWREAAAHAPFGVAWPEGTTSEEIEAIRDSLKSTLATLRALAPESGAYLNEVSMQGLILRVTVLRSNHRLRHLSRTQRILSSVHTTSSSGLSRQFTTPTICSLSRRVSRRMSGTRT